MDLSTECGENRVSLLGEKGICCKKNKKLEQNRDRASRKKNGDKKETKKKNNRRQGRRPEEAFQSGTDGGHTLEKLLVSSIQRQMSPEPSSSKWTIQCVSCDAF